MAVIPFCTGLVSNQIWDKFRVKTRGKELFSSLGLLLSPSVSDSPTESDFTVAHHLSKMSQCQDFPIFTFCPLQCNYISCYALSTAVHHLPNNSYHLLGNAVLQVKGSLLPSQSWAPHSDRGAQHHRSHIPFLSHMALAITHGPGLHTCSLVSGPGFLLSWGLQQLLAALPPCPCPPSLHSMNPSMPSWLPFLCFMTVGPPPGWKCLNQNKREESFGSFTCVKLCMMSSFEVQSIPCME